MKLYSTAHQSPDVSLAQAVINGLPPDNGLYLPKEIPRLPSSFFEGIEQLNFNEIAYQVSKCLLQGTISDADLRNIIDKAFGFGTEIHQLNADTQVLELFHGPSAAFKDFGARFMAALLTHFLVQSHEKITILVATSGDTGGAVALGFLDAPNIDVVILYPKGKVSPLQEKQLTTLGKNIRALEVEGSFDDCQALVKQAFLDKDLSQNLKLSSANSINIARLIPQSFYYFDAYRQLKSHNKPLVFVVPSGNFGNLCGALFAQKMGLPIAQIVAATNANAVVPTYLQTGVFAPQPSIATISNAMDVGNPSNFARLAAFFPDVQDAKKRITGCSFDDAQTLNAIEEIHEKYDYVVCPHTAVGYLGWQHYQKNNPNAQQMGVVLATAHPAKFLEVIPPHVAHKVVLPPSLELLSQKTKQSVPIKASFEVLKAYLLG